MRAGLGAVFLGKEDVVILAGVEGRIEVDEVYGLGAHVALEDFVVVAVVELVLFLGHGFGVRVAQGERVGAARISNVKGSWRPSP